MKMDKTPMARRTGLVSAFQHVSFSAFLFLCLLCLLVANTSAAVTNTVSGSLQDFTSAPVAARRILVVPVAVTNTTGTITVYDRRAVLTDTNGQWRLTNVVPGTYTWTVQGPPDTTSWTTLIPGTNADYNVRDLLVVSTNATTPADSVAWSTTVSDARYAPIGSTGGGGTGTNAYATNAFLVIGQSDPENVNFVRYALSTGQGDGWYWDAGASENNFGPIHATYVSVDNGFQGDGTYVTNLNASSLASGTVPLARLSGLTSAQLAPATWQQATNQIDYLTAGPRGPLTSQVSRNDPSLPKFYLASGAGILRDIRFISAMASSQTTYRFRTNVSLRVYADAGAISNLATPPAGNLLVDMPISVLLGNTYRHFDKDFRYQRSTRYLDAQEENDHWADYGNYSFSFKLPMPFSNGCYVALWDLASNRPVTNGYSTVTYEPVAALPAEWGGLRFRSHYVSAMYTNAAMPFLATPVGGRLMGICGSWRRGTTNAWQNIFEGVWRIVQSNDLAQVWESSGGEDLFQSPYEFRRLGSQLYCGLDYGTTSFAPDDGSGQNYTEAYAWFPPALTPVWTNAVLGELTDLNVNTQAFWANTLALYYSSNLVGGTTGSTNAPLGTAGAVTPAVRVTLDDPPGTILGLRSLVSSVGDYQDLDWVNTYNSDKPVSTRIRAYYGTNGSYSADMILYTRPAGQTTTNPPTERLRILSTGEVGIGTATPSTALTVNGVITGSGAGLSNLPAGGIIGTITNPVVTTGAIVSVGLISSNESVTMVMQPLLGNQLWIGTNSAGIGTAQLKLTNGALTVSGQATASAVNSGTWYSGGLTTIKNGGNSGWMLVQQIDEKNSGGLGFGLGTTNWPCIFSTGATNAPTLVVQAGMTSPRPAHLIVSGQATVTNGIVLPSSAATIKWSGITASNPPTSGAGTAYLFAATNGSGTAEIFTMDGAGTIKQISEHNMDAPPTMLDDGDPFPNVAFDRNIYLGQVRWINRSREATISQLTLTVMANSYEMWLGKQVGANVGLLQNNNVWATNRAAWATSASGTNWYLAMKQFNAISAAGLNVLTVESYDAYNTRLGLTNGNGLTTTTWTAVETARQAEYATGYTNSVASYTAAVAAGDTNAVAPTWTPPARKPVPDWLYSRGVR
jgi:hypothetical protein